MSDALVAAPTAIRAFCTFRAGDRLYGIEVESLREISTNVSITPVPQAPAAVRGLANLRSRILLVLDLRPLLGLAPVDCTAESRLIILKPTVAEETGVLVDRGGEIVRVPQGRIEMSEASSAAPVAPVDKGSLSLVVGVCKLEKELMMIIDATRFPDAVASLLK